MSHTPQDWLHLADCLRASRNGRSVAAIAEATGISHATIEAYETGRTYRRPPDKMWRLVNYYRWTPDSLRNVLAGGYPTVLPPLPPMPPLGKHYRTAVAMVNNSGLPRAEKRLLLRQFEEREKGVAI